jgi:hypothetical protein
MPPAPPSPPLACLQVSEVLKLLVEAGERLEQGLSRAAHLPLARRLLLVQVVRKALELVDDTGEGREGRRAGVDWGRSGLAALLWDSLLGPCRRGIDRSSAACRPHETGMMHQAPARQRWPLGRPASEPTAAARTAASQLQRLADGSDMRACPAACLSARRLRGRGTVHRAQACGHLQLQRAACRPCSCAPAGAHQPGGHAQGERRLPFAPRLPCAACACAEQTADVHLRGRPPGRAAAVPGCWLGAAGRRLVVPCPPARRWPGLPPPSTPRTRSSKRRCRCCCRWGGERGAQHFDSTSR